ncbi:hypothetical protein [Nannocystis pusilla]|uniref:hypothetical protein n=1 Tax=Nannocystis pusilla TaxID=889268 RepID=UPI003B77F358
MNVLTGETGAGKSIIVDALALLRGPAGAPRSCARGGRGPGQRAVRARRRVAAAAGAGARRAGDRGGSRGAGARARGRPRRPRALGGPVRAHHPGDARAGRRAADRHLQPARAPLADARGPPHRSARRLRRPRRGDDGLLRAVPRVASGGPGGGRPAASGGRGRRARTSCASRSRRSIASIRSRASWRGCASGRCCCATPTAGPRSPARPTTCCTSRTTRSPGAWRSCSTRPAAGPTARAFGEIQEQLIAAQVACEEAAAAAARFANEMSFEPGDLEQVEERLHELETLKRKHGGDLEALPSKLTAMREELSQLEHADSHLEALDAREQELLGKCLQRAKQLHARRAAAAEGWRARSRPSWRRCTSRGRGWRPGWKSCRRGSSGRAGSTGSSSCSRPTPASRSRRSTGSRRAASCRACCWRSRACCRPATASRPTCSTRSTPASAGRWPRRSAAACTWRRASARCSASPTCRRSRRSPTPTSASRSTPRPAARSPAWSSCPTRSASRSWPACSAARA